MQLDQPIPPAPSGGENPYDFILQGNRQPKKGLLPQANSPKQRVILALIVGTGILLLLVIILATVLSGGSNNKDLVSIAQAQTEIIRVSNTGTDKAKTNAVQNFAETVTVTMNTSQQQTQSYLSAHKAKLDNKTLALGRNSQTDSSLKTAEAAGNYDQELATVLEKSLSDYQAQISTAYKHSSSTSQKKLLQQLFSQVSALIKNQPATS